MTEASFAYDAERGCVGEIMDQLGQDLYLRPIGGGVEWSVESTRARPATRTEITAAKTGLLNPSPPSEPKIIPLVEPCTRPCAICQKAGRQSHH